MEQQDQRPSRHVCLTRRAPLGISSDPELDMLQALADPDVLTMVRGLAREEARSPFPDGLFGLDSPRTNAAIRRMRDAGLISSRRDGNDHVYFLNAPRFRDLEHFISGLIAKDRSRLEPAELEVLDPVPPDHSPGTRFLLQLPKSARQYPISASALLLPLSESLPSG